MTGIRLREGAAADIDAAMAVMVRAFDPAFGEAWSRGQCLGILPLPDVWLTLAELEDARPVGFTLSRVTFEDAELLLLAVDPASRGQGIGRALVAHAAAAAARRGATRLLLEVRHGNPALALYRREGFGEIGRRRDYYRGRDGATHDALTLARALPTPAQPLYGAAMSPDRLA